MIQQPFFPAFGKGQTVTTTGSNQTVTLTSDPKQVCITNIGAAVIYVRIDANATDAKAATTADYPILPNSQRVISKISGGPQNTPPVLSLIGTAANTVHVIEGEGYLH